MKLIVDENDFLGQSLLMEGAEIRLGIVGVVKDRQNAERRGDCQICLVRFGLAVAAVAFCQI